jgi:hypothetical protein
MQKIEAKKADEEENGDSRGSCSASFDGSLDPGRKAESQAKVGKIACFAQTYTVNGLVFSTPLSRPIFSPSASQRLRVTDSSIVESPSMAACQLSEPPNEVVLW